MPTSLTAGSFVTPTVFKVDGIGGLEREVFGPVLHVATYEASDLERVLEAINAAGYGLTLGLHTRVDSRVQQVVDAARVGNLYVNRNQIGAVVGSQPFGGEGLSGTGPKAGGPHYLDRFRLPPPSVPAPSAAAATDTIADPTELNRALSGLDPSAWALRQDRAAVLRRVAAGLDAAARPIAEAAIATAETVDLSAADLPGPTGESNRLTLHPRGVLLCLGDEGGSAAGLGQAFLALTLGNAVVLAWPGAAAASVPLRAAGVPVTAVDGQVALPRSRPAGRFRPWWPRGRPPASAACTARSRTAAARWCR